jgi:hypothetical protein
MKIVCTVSGGPNDGTYEDDNWPRTHSYPLRGWGAITDNFHLAMTFEATCQTVVETKEGGQKQSIEVSRKHKYQVISRDETDGVLFVGMKHCGVQAE